ncbi:MAG: hypothetical protein NT108_00230 [Candidatus Kaiserbacteria bacterium]|nr:hypothetical protein [Candidatus Kaiserbacteria bacterium]
MSVLKRPIYIRKGLTFRASSIGDCLMGKYFLENIYKAHPEARCAIVVGSRGAMIRDLFAAYPWLEIIEANRRNPFSLIELGKKFHGTDVTLTQYAGKNGGSFSLMSKLAARMLTKRGGLIGFQDSFPFNGVIYDRVLPLLQKSAPVELERSALTAAMVPIGIPMPSFLYTPQPQIFERLGLHQVKYVVLHLFSGGKARGVSPWYRQELISKLSKVLPDGHKLALTGSKAERESLKDIPSNALIVETSMQELAALIAASVGMVSLDTGAAHLAAHLRKPLIVLASCVGEQWWSREMYGEHVPAAVFTRTDVCAAGHDYSEYAKCLEAITIDDVAHRAKELFL